MRYIDNFDSTDDPEDQPLVIHRHGSSPGRALIVLLHGLGGRRYGTWTPSGEDPKKVGLARFLYEDMREANRLVGEFSSERGWTKRGVDILLADLHNVCLASHGGVAVMYVRKSAEAAVATTLTEPSSHQAWFGRAA